ncbi:type II toxin-antitoxin system RelE/ParE family toxin [Nostocaceae cyanobacterium CENA357]|uniref:Type II toxin-antitoxin system RelE/ParE family toxin n=1 Tax=Atlanticothrix silvestris CENA357 TaxID=1725252 RepID=A0A8J7HGL1_9CYAN|nr:type II toxin-antitoxin system RelE/ParE family toxin [Atlanticothrix silvestris]MBH8551943.1 type II toxin-antitoxin system RelE/ParE family toxin [Atlanticothrix silvestris CENA357]
MSYQVQVLSTVVQQIEKLNPSVQQEVVKKLEELAINPLPEGAKKLEDEKPLYLVRFNDYRIVYRIQEEASLITVTKVAHPKDYLN